MSSQAKSGHDPYKLESEATLNPPVGFKNSLKFLGPGLILVGSVVGSGEIILTTTLGSVVGFSMLWFVLISCWGKNIIQAELARYTVSSGEPVLEAFNRLPGKLPGFSGKKVSWFIYLWILWQIPVHMGGGGIYGGAGQAVHMAMPFVGSEYWTILLAALAAGIILTGTYRSLEKLMTVMVTTFTLITLTCAVLLQLTEFAITWEDVQAGLMFQFPTFAVAAALAMYGGTGVTAGETMAYTYWCVEKGYARYSGPADAGQEWVGRAKGWIKVMQMDVLLTMALLTCATIPFYMLGAGVLHRLGQVPDGLETISILSNTYTHTLGEWAYWLFTVGAFFVLYSTVVSGLGGGSRLFADCLTVLGVIDRNDYPARLRVIRIWAVVSPAFMSFTYFFFQNPVWMLTVGNIVGSAITPIVAASTIYLRYKHTDARVRPSWKSDLLLWLCFGIMVGLGAYVINVRYF